MTDRSSLASPVPFHCHDKSVPMLVSNAMKSLSGPQNRRVDDVVGTMYTMTSVDSLINKRHGAPFPNRTMPLHASSEPSVSSLGARSDGVGPARGRKFARGRTTRAGQVSRHIVLSTITRPPPSNVDASATVLSSDSSSSTAIIACTRPATKHPSFHSNEPVRNGYLLPPVGSPPSDLSSRSTSWHGAEENRWQRFKLDDVLKNTDVKANVAESGIASSLVVLPQLANSTASITNTVPDGNPSSLDSSFAASTLLLSASTAPSPTNVLPSVSYSSLRKTTPTSLCVSVPSSISSSVLVSVADRHLYVSAEDIKGDPSLQMVVTTLQRKIYLLQVELAEARSQRKSAEAKISTLLHSLESQQQPVSDRSNGHLFNGVAHHSSDQITTHSQRHATSQLRNHKDIGLTHPRLSLTGGTLCTHTSGSSAMSIADRSLIADLTAKKIQLEGELLAAQQLWVSAREESDAFRSKLASSERARVEAELEVDVLHKQIFQMRGSFLDQERELSQARIAQIQAERDKSREILSVKQSQHAWELERSGMILRLAETDKLKEQLAKVKTDLAELEEKEHHERMRLVAVESDYSTLKQQSGAALSALELQLGDTQTARDIAIRTASDAVDRVNQTSAHVEQTRDRVTKMETELVTQRQRATDAIEMRDRLVMENKVLESNLAALTKSRNALATELHQIKAQLTHSTDQLNRLSMTQAVDKAEAGRRCTQLESQRNLLAVDRDNLSRELDRVTQELTVALKAVKDSALREDEANATMSKARKEILRLREEMGAYAKLQSDHAALKDQVQDLLASVARSSATELKLEATEEVVEELTALVEGERNKCVTLENALKDAKHETDEMKQKYLESEERCNELLVKLKHVEEESRLQKRELVQARVELGRLVVSKSQLTTGTLVAVSSIGSSGIVPPSSDFEPPDSSHISTSSSGIDDKDFPPSSPKTIELVSMTSDAPPSPSSMS